MRETSKDESQCVPSPGKLFKTRDLKLPKFEGSLPSCSLHSAGYTRTSVHPYFPVAKGNGFKIAVTEFSNFRIKFGVTDTDFVNLSTLQFLIRDHYRPLSL